MAYRSVKTTILVLSILSSIVFLNPLLIADEGTKSNVTRLWGRVVDSETERPLKGAIISIKNLQTGNTITLTQEEGQYRLDDSTGYFSLTASCEGYFDSGDGHNETMILKGDIKKMVLKLDEIVKELNLTGNVFFNNETINAIPLNAAMVSLYCTDGRFKGYEDSAITNNGYYEFKVFSGEFLLIVEKEGFLTNVSTVNVDEMNDVELDIIMTVGGSFEIFGYAEDRISGENIDGIMVKLYDVNNSREFTTLSNTSYFHLEIYPSTFDIIVDADNFHPFIQTGIIINEVYPVEVLYAKLEKDDMEENLTVEVTVLDGDFSKLKVVRNWDLNSDSVVRGFDSEAGNLKMKIDSDGRFGNGDGTVSDVEVSDFKAWYEKIGPEYLYTDEFFKVNETAYSPDFIQNTTILNYDIVLYEFEGDVNNQKDMKIKTSMKYNNDDMNVTASDNHAYSIWLGDLETSYTVTFNSTYEIITEENDDWGFALDDNGDAIRYKVKIFNATTLEIFKKVAPEGNVTITVNGVLYYPGDEIFVGSASDDLVMNNDFENITFDASGSSDKVGEIANYTWNFGDGNTDYGVTVTHNYSLAAENTQIYKASLNLRDSAGDTEVIIVTIVVDATSPTLPPSDQLVDTPTTERNQSELIEFNASKSMDFESGIPDYKGNYLWEFADGTEKFGKTVENVFYEAGETKINLTVKDAVGNSKKTSVTIEILDAIPPVVDILGPPSAEVNSEMKLYASPCYDNVDALEFLKFQWDFNDLEMNSITNRTTMNVTLRYRSPGVYVIKLNVTDKSGNTASAAKTISITAPDLFVVRIDVSDRKPQKGEKIDVGTIIENLGWVPARNFTVSLLIDDEEEKSTIIEYLAPGEKIPLNFTWKANSEGEHLIKVFVDREQWIYETDETNNYEEILVNVHAGPPRFIFERICNSGIIGFIVVIIIIILVIVIYIALTVKKMKDTKKQE